MSVFITASQISLFPEDIDEANPLILFSIGTKSFCLLSIVALGQNKSTPLFFEILPSKIFQMDKVSMLNIQILLFISTKRKEA